MPAVPVALTRSATRPRPGSTASGSASSQGDEHERPLMGPRVRQGQRRVGADLVAAGDDVHVQRARPPALRPDAVQAPPRRPGSGQELGGGQARAAQQHRVQVVVLGRAADRGGLVDAGDRGARKSPAAQQVDRRAGGWPAGRRGCCRGRARPRSAGRLRGVRQGQRAVAARSRAGSAEMVTVMSATIWVTGACGLCTVTSASRTAAVCQAGGGQPVGQRLDQRHWLPADDRGQPVGERPVVSRQRQVVGCRGRPGVEPRARRRRRSPGRSRRSCSSTPWLPRTRSPSDARSGPGSSSDRARRASSRRPRRGPRPAPRPALPGTSCTRTHQAPAATARAVSAMVASSLPANGRGSPSGPASSLPRKPLARGRDQHRERRPG